MVFDTNALVYAAREDSEFHVPFARQVRESRSSVESAFITTNICYEFLRVITHPGVYDHPWDVGAGIQYLAMLLASPSFGLLLPSSSHLTVLSEVVRDLPDLRGSILHDLHTVVLMREHGITQICTRDRDFQRFPSIEVIDPTE